MKHGISSSLCALVVTLAISASPLWAVAASTGSSKGLTVTVPPEKRVAMRQVDMPENVMTRAIRKDIEDEKHQPIKDQAGNIQYIVMFADNASTNYPDKAVKDSRFADWQNGKVVQLLHDVEATHQFSASHLYSQTIQGFAAYLTPQQVNAFGRDSRIKQLSQSLPGEFSGIWNDIQFTNETLPWGIQAVGGGKASNGVARVYVVDSGIGQHSDLNVSDRWASPGSCLIGNYAHSTFVAGIIGARNDGVGVLGVDSAANIVSLAYGDNTCAWGSQNTANMISAFEEAKVRIGSSGRVGVVNFSTNFDGFIPNTSTASPEFIAFSQSIRGLITPNPSTGYPGAFFVQSAGNQFKDACQWSFPDHLGADGAMVIGAMDSNGQPVQPLNGEPNGFQGNSNFGGAPGSNFGTCVDAWAPGKKILSTWNNGGYVVGDGTSFAAPHVAGIAAYLIETFPYLLTPADVENAVRARMVGSGASDLQSLPVRTVNLDGASYTARPTVEFKIGNSLSDPAPTPIGQAPSPIVYSDGSFNLRYDSVGAQNCDLQGYVNGNLWYQVLNFQTNYNWGNVQLQPDQYRWDVSCRSAGGVINTASASATVTAAPPTPIASFSVNGIAVADGATMSFSYPQSFSLAYNSTNTTSCTLTAWNAPPAGFLSLWYSIPGFYPSYDWGAVTLDRGIYQWQIDCMNANFPDRSHVYSTLNMYIL